VKIDRIECVNLRFEYPTERQFWYSAGRCTARVTSLIFVHTDTGHIGVGSTYSHPALVHLLVKGQFEPLLRGEDAADVEGLWAQMYGASRWYGRKGVAMSTLGGIDTALWDLRGQVAGQPVWALLGGEDCRSCPAYASALLWKENVEELAAEAAALVERGFRRVKMRMGQSEEYDTTAVRAVRKAVGPRIDIMVDAGMRYNVALAQRVGRVLEEERVFWYEEPFTPEDVDSYAALRGTVDVPVAAGENEFGEQGFRELIRARAVDIVQPDASRCGGITEVVRVARMAADAGLRFAPHTWSDAVTVTANAHVVAALPGGVTVEVDQTGNPFIQELLVEPLSITEGELRLSRKPGLGIEIDHAAVERLRMADPLVVPDGRYSDLVFGKEYYTPAGPYEELR
jgi:L-alanine-DL-glutamate epimerase-like enolase superfamily enzyme